MYSKYTALLLVTCLVLVSCLPVKQLQGPASEFSSKELPSPLKAAEVGHSAVYSMRLFAKNSQLESASQKELDVDVDSPTSFSISVFSPYESKLKLDLHDSTGKKWNLGSHKQITVSKDPIPLGDGGVNAPSVTYVFSPPYPLGEWKLTLTPRGKVKKEIPGSQGDVVVNVWNEGSVKLHSHLSTYDMVQGSSMGLVASLYNEKVNTQFLRGSSARPMPMQLQIDTPHRALMEVTLPNGTVISVDMRDDGLRGDLSAGDNLFTASFDAADPGEYSTQAVFSGVANDGVRYTRTTQHIMRVVAAPAALSTSASVSEDADGMLQFDIDVNIPEPLTGVRGTGFKDELTAYAQVWGTHTTTGLKTPVAWMSGVVKVDAHVARPSVRLGLSSKWLEATSTGAPFELRKVRIQNQLVPISERESINVRAQANFATQLKSRFTGKIDEEMSWGVRPAGLQKTTTASKKSGLVLVHGYCVDVNPWQHYENWTDGYFFEHFRAADTNDQFARLVDEFALRNGLESYSLIAHSQGGLASVHLHNYYWTGLEKATGGRLIQSVGSPYYGSGLAGTIAGIGSVFGVGCGKNFDLTHDGAALWMNGIKNETQEDVYFYTSQYDTHGMLHYCNIAANAVLAWPNDGVTELKYSVLPHGNHVSHTKAECHTYNMKFPPQAWSETRNAELNVLAAR